MSYHTQSDLGVQPSFQADQSATKELPKIKQALTPVDKLLVLKRTVGLIREAIDANVRVNYPDNSDLEMSTDDLVIVVVWVIVRTCLDEGLYDFASEIEYIAQFHFVSLPTSHLEFTLCHFQVALGWINGHIGGMDKDRDKASSPIGGHSHTDFMFAADTERCSSPLATNTASGLMYASCGGKRMRSMLVPLLTPMPQEMHEKRCIDLR